MDVSSLRNRLNQGLGTDNRVRTEPKVQEGPALDPTTANPAGADTYHGADDPAAQKLLGESGIDAYSRLFNVGYVNDLYDRSVEQLTEVMPKASVGLVLSYHSAVNSLSKELQQKDWGFSVSDGKLVFLEGNDKLSEKDFAELRKAFGDTDVESSANQVADAVVESVNLRRKSGEPTNTLAWGRFLVDKKNFSEVVNLREFTTSIMPGGQYNQWSVNPEDLTVMHNVIGPRAMIDLLAANAEEAADGQKPGRLTRAATHVCARRQWPRAPRRYKKQQLKSCQPTTHPIRYAHSPCAWWCGIVCAPQEQLMTREILCGCSQPPPQNAPPMSAFAGICWQRPAKPASTSPLLSSGRSKMSWQRPSATSGAEENREAIQAYNDHIDKHGVFSDDVRRF